MTKTSARINIFMFKVILKHLFPVIEEKIGPNYFYFEKDKVSDEALQQQALEELQSIDALEPLHLASVEESHNHAFYDFLFGQSSVKNTR